MHKSDIQGVIRPARSMHNTHKHTWQPAVAALQQLHIPRVMCWLIKGIAKQVKTSCDTGDMPRVILTVLPLSCRQLQTVGSQPCMAGAYAPIRATENSKVELQLQVPQLSQRFFMLS